MYFDSEYKNYMFYQTNTYGTVRELRSSFSHIKSNNILSRYRQSLVTSPQLQGYDGHGYESDASSDPKKTKERNNGSSDGPWFFISVWPISFCHSILFTNKEKSEEIAVEIQYNDLFGSPN